MERDQPGEESESVVEKEELAGGGCSPAGAGETRESWASGSYVRRWENRKVNKHARVFFLLIGKSGKRLEEGES